MKKQLVLVNLLLLSLGFFLVPNTQAQECPKISNTRSTAYIQREGDKRCEGVKNISEIDKFFSLISFTVGRINNLPGTLQLEVPIPKINQAVPKVRLLSFVKNYQLDTLDLSKKGNRYQFKWSNSVLKSESIDPNTLRAIVQPDSSQTLELKTNTSALTLTVIGEVYCCRSSSPIFNRSWR